MANPYVFGHVSMRGPHCKAGLGVVLWRHSSYIRVGGQSVWYNSAMAQRTFKRLMKERCKPASVKSATSWMRRGLGNLRGRRQDFSQISQTKRWSETIQPGPFNHSILGGTSLLATNVELSNLSKFHDVQFCSCFWAFWLLLLAYLPPPQVQQSLADLTDSRNGISEQLVPLQQRSALVTLAHLAPGSVDNSSPIALVVYRFTMLHSFPHWKMKIFDVLFTSSCWPCMCLCSYNQFLARCICLKKSRGFLAADCQFSDEFMMATIVCVCVCVCVCGFWHIKRNYPPNPFPYSSFVIFRMQMAALA